MPSFANTALRLLRRILGAPSHREGPYRGSETALDGNTAVAVVEATVSEAAGLGATFPADTASIVWRAEQQRLGTNLMGKALSGQVAESPRGALATAIGLALSGVRATAFLSSQDLASAQDLLVTAAGRQVPLVLHLSQRALAGHSAPVGSGHEAYHLSADSGCFLLFAANVQEAVDLTLIARRVAELTLIPGLVAMDGERTALAIQEVRLPPPELVETFLGSPEDPIPSPTAAQKLLFGDTRRRVPRWHDPDRPVLQGALQSPESWGLGKAASRAYVESHLNTVLDESIGLFAKHTGREHRPISAYRMDDADLVLVAQGAAIETAEAVTDLVRSTHKLKVGVLGLRCLRPFPGKEAAAYLAAKRRVCVLERLDSPLAEEPPLLRELRAALGRAAVSTAQSPRFLSVLYGMGGTPFEGADLVRLCTEAESIQRAQVYLGIAFARTLSAYPKRQVLLDRLRRSYPEINDLGLEGSGPLPDLRPKEAITLAIHRISGQVGEGLAAETAAFLRQMAGGQLRSRPALSAEPWGSYCVDRITSAPERLKDPGDQTPVDLAVLLADAENPLVDPLADLQGNGILLCESPASPKGIPATLKERLRASGIGFFGVPAFSGSGQGQPIASGLRIEYLLGAVFGVLVETGLLDTNSRRLVSGREEALSPLDGDLAEARLNAFKAGLEGVQRLELAAIASAEPLSEPLSEEAPRVVRRLGNIDNAYDSLPRFWDQVGVLYRSGESRDLIPDPYLATGTIPPLSSAFRDLSPMRGRIPTLDPAACTGCGACWSRCPDAAIGAAAVGPGALLDTFIGIAGADVLRPVTSKLATRVSALCQKPEGIPATAGEILTGAFDWLQEKMTLPAERKQPMQDGFSKVVGQLGCLPVAVTEPFFLGPEKNQKGGGELLFLAINPDACKECGICISACDAGALTYAPQARQSLEEARRVWRAWEQLPDTPQATVARLGQTAEVDDMAAILLSRRCAQALAGGDGAEPGSGERLALRLALAAVEARYRPLVEGFLGDIRATRDKIAVLIRKLLSDALPADDLDSLARGLESVDTDQTNLTAFINDAEHSRDSGIDAARLRRLVDLARRLGDLENKVADGRQGFGRSRVGLVLSSDGLSGWTGVFPNNPFRDPVSVDLTGDGAQLAAGLLEGQLRLAVEGFAVLRKARLELDHPTDAARMWTDLDGLSWRDLTKEERALCPSLLLVGSSNALAGRGLSQVAWLLGTDLPVKMMLLADLSLGLSTRAGVEVRPAAAGDPSVNVALLTLAQRNACTAQTSLGAPGHMLKSLQTAFAFDGPALIHLHAPSPGRHGFAPARTVDRSRAAVVSRVFPLFLYDPKGEGVFGSRLRLDANPEPRSAWAGNDAAEAPTPASWALGEARFASAFAPLREDAPGPTPLSRYLLLDHSEREGKTPFVSMAQNGAEPARFSVDHHLVKSSEERLHAWRTLQELAGLITPFTARVEHEIREQVAAEHEAALASLKQEYERRILDLEAEMREKTREEIRDRLMRLAGYRGASAGAQPPTGTDR